MFVLKSRCVVRILRHHNCLSQIRLMSASSSANKLTKVTQENGVRRITLNNPAKRNALSYDMLQCLHHDLTTDMDTPEVRCVILDAEGSIFSSGHDLKELMTKNGTEYHKKVFDTCSNVMLTIQKLPVPVIAKVNGVAAAAGCQLVASCDIVVATEKSSFSTPGASVGIFCSTPGVAVARCLPQKATAYMLMTGIPITAKEARDLGMVSKVVPENQLDIEIQKIVDAIKEKSYSITKLGKQFFYQQMELSISEAYCAGGQVMVNNLTLQDSQEGIDAFLHKQSPIWTHTNDKVKTK